MKKQLSIKNQILSFAGLMALVAVFAMGIDPIHAAGGVSLAALTAGFSKICGARSGGVVRAWGANVSDVTSLTYNSGTGEYTAITMVSGKVFYKYEFDQDSAEMKWPGSVENMSTKITKSLEFYLGKLTSTHRHRLQDLYDSSPCGMIWICEDANGQKWVLGYTQNFTTERPMRMKSSDSSTGKTFTDPNGSVVTLETTDNELPRIYTGVVPVV